MSLVEGPTLLQVRAPDGVRVLEVADWTSLTVSQKFNQPDTWILELPSDTDAALLFRQPGYGLVVDTGGSVLLSGPASRWKLAQEPSGGTLTVSGMSDDVWLARRLALPDPDGNFATAEFDVRTGLAGTVIRQYVDANAGLSAQLDRQVLQVAADQAEGTTVTGRARFDQLDQLVSALALAGGDLGWKVTDVAGDLVFDVFVPADRSATAVFSVDLGNLAGFSLDTTAPSGTYVYVGGDGDGVARTFVETQDGTAVGQWGRIEQFADGGRSDATSELEQVAAEVLAQAAQPAALAVRPIDTDAMTFGVDYELGDLVTVEVGGVPIVEKIREVTVRFDETGRRVVPKVQPPGAAQTLELVGAIARTQRRLDGLERRR